MPDIQPVRQYGNPFVRPGQQNAPVKEPGRFPPNVYGGTPGGNQENPGLPFHQFWPQDESIVRDRHAVTNYGNRYDGVSTASGSERKANQSGPDPLRDGKPNPSHRMINRTFNYQMGTTNTRNQDDLSRGYREVQTGQWAGTQDGSTVQVWGGTPGLWEPYGSYAGYASGPVQGIQGPEIGSAGDGPQLIPNSPPHGLHSRTYPNYLQTKGRYESLPQQRAGRVDRPSNSRIAGQSFSQLVVPQGQARSRNVPNPANPRAIQAPWQGGTGWRGA